MSSQKYRDSARGKAKQWEYNHSEKGKAKHKAYWQSERGKAKAKAYRESPEGRAKINAGKRRKQAALRGWVDEMKGNPCTDCGKMFPPVAMQFDHLPEYPKVQTISRMVAARKRKEEILAEIAKCELVCANCHAMRTQMRLVGAMD